VDRVAYSGLVGIVSSASEDAAGPVVERFARGPAQWLGWFGVVVGITTMVIAVANGPSNWREITLGAAIAIVSWVVLIRPRASLHEHGVFFRNMLRDAFIPASKIEACHTSHTLMVRAEAVVYHCPAITRSARSMMREKHGRASVLGLLGGLGGSNAPPPAPAESRCGAPRLACRNDPALTAAGGRGARIVAQAVARPPSARRYAGPPSAAALRRSPRSSAASTAKPPSRADSPAAVGPPVRRQPERT
jgi:hypothetical protein